MSLKLVLAMESDGATAGDNDDVEAANTATEVEAGAAELTEVEGEVGEYADGIDTSISATEELGEVNDVLAAGVESGEGVSEETAKMAEIAVEAICAKVGISARQARIMPAMESFGSTNSRLTATKLAMETIKETATRIWEAIKKAAIHIWNVIKSFFAGLLKNRSMLEKHLKNLQERQSKANGAPKKKTFTNGAKAFSIDGKANFMTVQRIVTEASKIPAMAGKLSEVIISVTSDSFVVKSIVPQFTAALSAVKGAPAGDNKTAYGKFADGRAVVFTTPKDDKQIPTLAIETIEKNPAKEIDAPTKDQIATVLKDALDTLSTLKEFDKISKTMEKAMKAAADFSEKMVKIGGEVEVAKADQKGTIVEDASKLASNVRAINNMASKVSVAFPSLMFAAVKSAADYANAGLYNLEEEKKDSK